MHNRHFVPFNDRLARDIRNTLSEALSRNLVTLDLEAVRQAANTFSAGSLLAPHHRASFCQTLLLCDQGLFFEFHDLLEGLWQEGDNEEKLTLQSLIRAGGGSIYLTEGHTATARSLGPPRPVLGLTTHGNAPLSSREGARQ